MSERQHNTPPEANSSEQASHPPPSSIEKVSTSSPDPVQYPDKSTIQTPSRPHSHLHRFSLNDALRQLLLQCVRVADAHRAKYGENDKKFEKVRELFLQNAPSRIWQYQTKPSVKTLRDKFRSLVCYRRKENKQNCAASGIAEELGEFELLLDELIAEKEEFELQEAAERNEATLKEERLVAAGERLQDMALERRRCKVAKVENSENQSERKKARNRRNTSASNDADDWEDGMQKIWEEKRRLEERKLAVHERELDLRREQWEEEKKDRELSREQNKMQLELISSLILQLKR